MIPKVIHYCWFGQGKKPEIFEQCYASWKKFCPDYEIIEWNETNFDITYNEFTRTAYESKKYAFVSDVARLYATYKQGGIYLDTDVELKAPLDHLLARNSFFFWKNTTQINTGMGFGAKEQNEIVKLLLNSYDSMTFSLDTLAKLACQNVNTQTIAQHYPSLQINGATQVIDGNCFISASEYYQMAMHYDSFSWKSSDHEKALVYARKNKTTGKLRSALQSSKIYTFFQKHNLKRIEKVYTFIVYDLFDYGITYWLIRIKQKLQHLFK